jgi:hypothetical protein
MEDPREVDSGSWIRWIRVGFEGLLASPLQILVVVVVAFAVAAVRSATEGNAGLFVTGVGIIPIFAFLMRGGLVSNGLETGVADATFLQGMATSFVGGTLTVGLLVLIAGSLMSFSGRQEGTVRLAPGESVELPGGETLNLVSFDFHQYEDGRPKDWVSKVTVTKGGMPVKPETEIRVNRPLRLGSLTLYQSSYSQDFALAVTAPDGTETRVARGGSYKAEGLDLFYMTTEPVQGGGMQIVARVKSAAGASALRVPKEGVQIGAFRAALLPSLSTGLEAVVDPGYLVVLVALALVGLGTALTFIQKLKDMHE